MENHMRTILVIFCRCVCVQRVPLKCIIMHWPRSREVSNFDLASCRVWRITLDMRPHEGMFPDVWKLNGLQLRIPIHASTERNQVVCLVACQGRSCLMFVCLCVCVGNRLSYICGSAKL